jgi:hypothetical protein
MAENTDPETPENEPVSIPPGTAETEMGDMEVVAIDDLNVDHAYQRDLDAGLVQRIAAGWDIVASGPIVVSRRPDGSLWIVNGQHRAAAAKVAGETHILAQVKSVAGMTPDEARVYEAELRLKGNTRRTDKSQERFRAQVAARHADSLAIVEIASKFNTRINPWNDQKHGIKGIEALDRKARAHKGAMGGALWTNYYRAMIEIYNTNLPQKSRLEWRTNPGPSSPEQRSAESAAQEAAQQAADSATSDEPPQD